MMNAGCGGEREAWVREENGSGEERECGLEKVGEGVAVDSGLLGQGNQISR